MTQDVSQPLAQPVGAVGAPLRAAHLGHPWRPRALQFRISERRLLMRLGDIVATVASTLLALWLWAREAGIPFTQDFLQPRAFWLVVLPALWLVLAVANNYYDLHVAARLRSSLTRLLAITVQLLILYLGAYFLAPRTLLPRDFVLFFAGASLVLTGLWRSCRLFLIGWTDSRRRTLIIGASRPAELITQAIKREAHGDYEVVGCVTSDHDTSLPPSYATVLGAAHDLPEIVDRHGISELVIAYINEVPDDVFQGVLACYERGVVVVPMPVLYEEITGQVPIDHVGEHLWPMVLPLESHSLGFTFYRMTKRLTDIVVAFVGLVLTAPLVPLLSLAVVLDSRGPALYRQRRLGRGGQVFTVVKFRTMVNDAESRSGARWAVARDTRVTRVGAFLRKTRLDELPQLLNILRGEMSVVGPRPERPEFVEMLAEQLPFYRTRLAVTPGLTGWAQIKFRYAGSVEDALRKLQYDLYYIRHQSLALDLLIMLRTIGTVVTLRGT